MRIYVTSRPIHTSDGNISLGYTEWRFSAEIKTKKITTSPVGCAVYSDREDRTGFILDVNTAEDCLFRFSPIERSMSVIEDDVAFHALAQEYPWTFFVSSGGDSIPYTVDLQTRDDEETHGRRVVCPVPNAPVEHLWIAGAFQGFWIAGAFQGFDERITASYSIVESGVRVHKMSEFNPDASTWTERPSPYYTNCSSTDMSFDVLTAGVWVKYDTRLSHAAYTKPSDGAIHRAAIHAEELQHDYLGVIAIAARDDGRSTVFARDYVVTQREMNEAGDVHNVATRITLADSDFNADVEAAAKRQRSA